MKQKSLFTLTIIFSIQFACMSLVASEENIEVPLALPQEIIKIIAHNSNCATIASFKRSCKLFADDNELSYYSDELIKREDYNVITKALTFFAQTNKAENFKKFLQNNYELRIADLQLMGYKETISPEEIMIAYKAEKTLASPCFNFDNLDQDSIKRITSINPNIIDQKFRPALHYIASKGNGNEIVRLLENKKTNPNILDPLKGCTLLHLACELNNIILVKLLLRYPNTNYMIKNWDNMTALDIATAKNHTLIQNLLYARYSYINKLSPFVLPGALAIGVLIAGYIIFVKHGRR